MERKQFLELLQELSEQGTQLVEYNGDLYTPEDLMAHLSLVGQFEIVEKEDKSWFEEAINEMNIDDKEIQ